MSEAEKDEFTAFVRRAGKVAPNELPRRVRQAAYLVRLFDEGKLVGTAAIKVPDAGYPEGVFAKANTKGADHFPRELGYVHVADSHQRQRYSCDLAEIALAAVQGVALFATTSSVKMERTLLRKGFTIVGDPYPSENEGETLKLFVRPA